MFMTIKLTYNSFKILALSMLGIVASTGHSFAQSEQQSGFFDVKFSGFIDARIVRTSDQKGWLDGGLGKSRYGAKAGGDSETQIDIAEVSLIIEPKFTWALTGMVHLQYTHEQTKAVDVVEAYLKYKPLSASKLRFSARAGLLYPPISLEHTDIGWTSPYSLTPSAINSWVGEEVKALTLEAKVGRRVGHHTFSFVLASFMANDPTTALLAWRGWALHDQKLTYFQRYPLPAVATLSEGGVFYNRQALWTEPHNELDNKPGYYAGLNWDYLGLYRINALYYDNRGDPAVVENKQYAWDSRFYSIGGSASPTDNIEFLAQYMTGNTKMGPFIGGESVLDMDYSSYYFMASYTQGEHRLSARYDNFDTTEKNLVASFIDFDNGGGKSFTLAYSYTPRKNHRIMAEWLYIDSDRNNRPEIGLAVNAVENQLQVSYRVGF